MRRNIGRRVACAATALIIAGGVVTVSGPSAPVAASTAVSAGSPATEVALRAGLSAGPRILWASDEEQAADLDAMKAAGASWMTLDIDWNHIQSDGPNSWRWDAATDRAVLATRERGLKIIGVAAYSPAWARRHDCPRGELHCFPQDAGAYGRFLGAAAARYGSRSPDERLRGSVTVWSLWNEPNHREFSMPRPDPDKYAAMVKTAYVSIKAADPSAIVLTGGTAPAPDAPDGTDYSPKTWLAGLYRRGAGGFFDGVAHHPYSFPTNPLEVRSWNAFSQTSGLYDIMRANGDGRKKVWGTEMGAPTGTAGDALSDAQQAQWVRDYFTGWNTTFRAFTGPLVWFQVRDSGTNPADKWQNLGLLRRDRSPKPAYAEFQSVTGGGVSWSAPDLSGVTVPKPGVRVAANPVGGYYTMAGTGTVRAYEGAPYYGSPRLPPGLARGFAVAPDGLGYLVLDAYGGVHKFGSAARGELGARRGPYWPGWAIARDLTLTPDGRGYSILDGFGGIHVVGAAPRYQPGYWRGWDIARAFAYSPDGGGIYVLDGFGGVHTAGNAVARPTRYWRGWDIARDLAVAADNGGFAVVDGFGGVHRSGSSPEAGTNLAYRGRDYADGIAAVAGGYVVAG